MNTAVIVAGGSGQRFGRDGGKQLAPVEGRPLLSYTLCAFEACDAVDAIVLVCHPDQVEECRRDAVEATGATKVVAVVPGGPTRRISVAAGLAAVPPDCDVVAVHDGARAMIEAPTIRAAIEALVGNDDVDGVVVGHPALDTVKSVDAAGRVQATLDRSTLWIAQTPQVFRCDTLRRAHARAEEDAFEGTDDASLVERDGGRVMMLEGPRWNFKVTMPEDLAVAAWLIAHRLEGGGTQ